MLQKTSEIIFATDFSDASLAAIPAVARWVDATHAKLTLLHVYNPQRTLYRDADAMLRSFFAEADNYPSCTRVLIPGEACDGIASYCKDRSNALLMLPPSDQTGLPRPFHRSLRARLIGQLNIPIWTLGKTKVSDPPPSPGRNIGVWLTGPEEGNTHLHHAAQYAADTGATLHLFYVMDDITEGSLTQTLVTEAPLGEESALNWLHDIAHKLSDVPKVEVAVRQGSIKTSLRDLVRESGAEMLMVSRRNALHLGFSGITINPALRACDAGIICVPKQSETQRILSNLGQLAYQN